MSLPYALPRWLQAVHQIIFVGALLSFGALMFVTHEFMDGPSEPNPTSGRVMPYSEHGRTRYITATDNDHYVLARNAMFVLYGVTFALALVGVINGTLRKAVGKDAG